MEEEAKSPPGQAPAQGQALWAAERVSAPTPAKTPLTFGLLHLEWEELVLLELVSQVFHGAGTVTAPEGKGALEERDDGGHA